MSHRAHARTASALQERRALVSTIAMGSAINAIPMAPTAVAQAKVVGGEIVRRSRSGTKAQAHSGRLSPEPSAPSEAHAIADLW